MSRTLVVFALALTVLGGAAWPVLASEGRGARADLGPRGHESLGLSEEQARDIRAIRARHRDTWRQLARSLRTAQQELRQLALDAGDEAAIQGKAQEVAELTRQLVQLRVQTLREIGPLLTPEQREKLAQRSWGPRTRPHGHRDPQGERPQS